MSGPGDPALGGDGSGRAAALAARLAELGLGGAVRADGGLAIVVLAATPASDVPWVDAPTRQAVIAAARAHGFTHVALELPASDAVGDSTASTDATVHRDQPAE